MKKLVFSFVILTFAIPAFSYEIIDRAIDKGTSESRKCTLSEKTAAKHLTLADYKRMGGAYSCKANKFNGDDSKTFYDKDASEISRAYVDSDCHEDPNSDDSSRLNEQLHVDPSYFTVRGSSDCSEKFVDLAFGQGAFQRPGGDVGNIDDILWAGQDSDVSEVAAKELFDQFQSEAKSTCNDLNRSKKSNVEIFNNSKENGVLSGKSSKIRVHFEARCHIQE